MDEKIKGIIHARIDDRVVHRQVATQWADRLGANRVMIVSNEVVNDDVKKVIVRLAAPPGVRASIITREVAVKNILSGRCEGRKVLIVATSPIGARFLIDNDLPITSINVGNLSRRSGAEHIHPTINITEEERGAFKELISDGVEVAMIQTPRDSKGFLKDFTYQEQRMDGWSL